MANKNILKKLKTASVSKDHKKTSEIPVAQLVMTDPNFRLFRRALRLTGLMNLLTDSTYYTIYAPTDTAFYSLGDNVIDYLFKKENLHYLTDIIKYHFSPKVYYYSSLFDYTYVPTLLGSRLPISNLDIDMGDIRLSDSVVHTVNSLNIPSAVYKPLSWLF